MSDAFDPFAGLPNPFSDPEVTTLTDKPTTTRCDGICGRCDGAGTIPDWSAGRLPCPACKPMEGSEATMAGAIRQSVGADRCPVCGADREVVGDYGDGRPVYRYHSEVDCLRRQLAEAQQGIAVLRNLQQAAIMLRDDLLAHNAQLRRLLDDVEWVRMLNDDGDVFEMCLFCDSIKERGHEDWCTRQTALADAPANPLAHFTDGQLYDELRRRGWKAATWAEEGGGDPGGAG